MNKSEILDIVRDSDRLNLLADQFRLGRDVGDLLTMLHFDNDEVVGAAAWIAGEINITPTDAVPMLPRLHELVNCENPSIRFHAIAALYPFIDTKNPADINMLTRLSADPSEGVRAIAKAALSKLAKEQASEPHEPTKAR